MIESPCLDCSAGQSVSGVTQRPTRGNGTGYYGRGRNRGYNNWRGNNQWRWSRGFSHQNRGGFRGGFRRNNYRSSWNQNNNSNNSWSNNWTSNNLSTGQTGATKNTNNNRKLKYLCF